MRIIMQYIIPLYEDVVMFGSVQFLSDFENLPSSVCLSLVIDMVFGLWPADFNPGQTAPIRFRAQSQPLNQF